MNNREHEARASKAAALADWLEGQFINEHSAAAADDADWVEWAAAAGVRPPSAATIRVVVAFLHLRTV